MDYEISPSSFDEWMDTKWEDYREEHKELVVKAMANIKSIQDNSLHIVKCDMDEELSPGLFADTFLFDDVEGSGLTKQFFTKSIAGLEEKLEREDIWVTEIDEMADGSGFILYYRDDEQLLNKAQDDYKTWCELRKEEYDGSPP